MIDVQQLRKQFGDTVAVDEVSFTAPGGAVFGLLGPNGAGKSTTIHCIAGLLVPTAGRVAVLGHDVVHEGLAARRQLGIVPQELALYEELSARDNLAFWGAAYGMTGQTLGTRVGEVLSRVGLADRAREPVKQFSGGMKRRLNFACGIVHHPKVLLLDEPTVGVDPQSRVRLLDLIREEVQAGTCVLYTTHYMEEAQALCDRLAIVDRGRMLASGTLDDLRRLIGEKDLVRLSGRFEPDAVTQALPSLGGIDLVAVDPTSVILAVEGAARRLPALLNAIAATGGDIQETAMSQPSLESLFIKLTGRQLRE
jgi:ABC-2 type transport system ATP-binding protein